MLTRRYSHASDLTTDEILNICLLKNQSWPHSIDSQISWWKKNTSDSDLIVTLVDGLSVVAFLRLRERKISVDGNCMQAKCVTEVCVEKYMQRKGLGSELLEAAKNKIDESDLGIGFLLCSSTEEPFYKACRWVLLEAQIQVESSSGTRRNLAINEKCMVQSLQVPERAKVILYGDVF